MKKFVLTVVVVFGIMVVSNAQEKSKEVSNADLKSKEGVLILPEAGDYAIGIDATPFLNYFGCFLSNAGGTAPTWNFINTTKTIRGKYYTDATTAYRGEIRLGVLGSTTQKNEVGDRTVTTAPTYPTVPTLKENKWKRGTTNIGIGAGIEKHRGKGRLSGYYGAGLGINFSSSKDKFTYGNALSPSGTVVNVDAIDDAFSGASNITTDTYGNAARITERKNGTDITLNLGVFVGAEYFILPKVSIGGEFGWGLGFGKTGKTETTTESIGGATPTVGTQVIDGNKAGSMGFDNGNFGGSLFMMLHF